MIRILNSEHAEFQLQLNELLDRDQKQDLEVERVVSEIIESVKTRGDQALTELTVQFDGFPVENIKTLELSSNRIDSIVRQVGEDVASAIDQAADRIRHYHEKELQHSWSYQEASGSTLGQKLVALDRVGVYVPGGKAAYPSSVLMTAIPARVAGVGEVIMTVPTPGGEVNPAVIRAAKIAGADRIFTVGGAQAIAALAFGTESVPAVDKIVGPGNTYVAAAKKQVFGKVGIDMIAGPSEVVVICDHTINPDWVAMDMFAQAEHDELAQSIAITDSSAVVDALQESIHRMLPEMERREIIESALTRQGAIIKVSSMAQAIEISNRIAPEHLELMVVNAESLVDQIRHAGAIFIGPHSAESLGDYCAGPNHVLPTAGTARFSSPLGTADFQKRCSLIQASQSGADEMARIASVLARCEGLTAHARSAEYRINKSLD